MIMIKNNYNYYKNNNYNEYNNSCLFIYLFN